jgi:Na+/H+-dicarboxylate symporter/ABC-type amino acid transport substrate-binding protein
MSERGVVIRWRRLSLSSRILIGLGLGMLTGLFLGELAQPLEFVSKAYIRLMQMTVVPYMAVALMVGLGQLSISQAKLLAVRGLVLLLLTWAIAFVIIVLMPLSFPELQAGSFYSTTLIEPKPAFDFIGLYIPANPFHALANTIVPAVVFFCATVGIALIGIENKAGFMSGLETVLEALTRVAKFILNLTPFGVFAIAAVTAGTMTLEQFARLQAYFLTFIVAALVLTFWILPALISALTPFKYKDILAVSKDALLTAFLTQSLFIVVPILVEHSKRIVEQYQMQTKDTHKLVDIIIPVTFNIPNVGKLLTLLFIPFTAWMAGSALELHDYPRLFLIGLASYFAKAQTALPFLMDQFEIPQDLFQLYIPTSIVTGKFDTLVSAINLLVFSLIGTGALTGYLVFKPAQILRYLSITAVVLVLTVTVTGVFLSTFIDTNGKRGQGLMQMRLMEEPVPVTVHRTAPDYGRSLEQGDLLTVRKIKERGVLKVGYEPFRYPFSFFNNDDQLVGFDAEVTSQLAADLGVRLEFVPFAWNDLQEKLDSGAIDLVPTVPYIATWLDLMEYSDPVLTVTIAFVVKDHRRHDFANMESLRKRRKLKIGVPTNPEYLEKQIKAWLPKVEFELVELSAFNDFFEPSAGGLDALISSAEIGTAFTLLHPEYAVVVPKSTLWRLPLGFAMRRGSFALSEYLDKWIAAHRHKGTFQRAYDHWILGEGAKPTRPRWSILRDVLHWID